MIHPKHRFLIGLLFLVSGFLLAVGEDLPAGSCDGPPGSKGSVTKARLGIRTGRRLLAARDFAKAAKSFERVAGYCEQSAGWVNVAEAASLASYAHERLGDKARAVRHAERAERTLKAIPRNHVDYSISRPVLKWVRSGLARLRPTVRVKRANLPGAPPFTDSLFPPSHRTRSRKTARRAPTRRKQASGRTGTVRIVSSPKHAAVVVDGKWKGRTPVLLLGLKPGKHRLMIRKKGYREESSIIRLAPHARLSLDFRMKRRGPKPAPPRREKTPAKKRRRLGKKSAPRKPAPVKNPPRDHPGKSVVADWSDGFRPAEEKTGQVGAYRLPSTLRRVFDESAPAGGQQVIDKMPEGPLKGNALKWGCFLDAVSIFYIFVPILLPMAKAAGVDPIHLGTVLTVNLAIGQITPPVGVNLLVAGGVTGEPLKGVARAVLPFVAAECAALLLITFPPPLSLWLPSLLPR